MSKAAYKYVTTAADQHGRILARGELKRGLKIGTEIHKSFEMREAMAKDMFAAESAVPGAGDLQFNAAVWAQTLIRVGTFEGPFTLGMLGELTQQDYAILRDAQMEIDTAGESA